MQNIQEIIEEDFKELFYEGESNSTFCRKHKVYATPYEIKEFARYEVEKAISTLLSSVVEEIKERKFEGNLEKYDCEECKENNPITYNAAFDASIDIIRGVMREYPHK